MKNILVPTDFSAHAKYALDFAVEIAKKASAKIKLVHVLEMPSSSSLQISGEVAMNDPMEKIFAIKLIEETEKRMKMLSDQIKDVKVETHIHPGNLYQILNREITNNGIDLLVMGSKGSTGIDELTVGSNTEKMVRYAACPVLTVKAPIKNEIKDIVFASDFSEDQPALIEQLKTMQSFFGAKLHVVKINTPHSFSPSRKDMSQIEGFINRYDLKNTTTAIYNDLNEEEGIMHYANEVGASLIAMGTSGRTGLGHFFIGSIAEDVVNHSKRPVWTYRIKK